MPLPTENAAGTNAGHPETDPAHMLPAHATEGAPAGGSALRKILVLALILGIVAFIVWKIHTNNAATAATATKAAAAANRPTPVLTAAVQQRTVPVYLTALGTVTAYSTVTLHSRVDGQLLSVNFKEGQTVSKGQLLLQIDPRPYQAAVDQAKGTLAKDEANAKNADAESARYLALFKAGVVSREQQQSQASLAGQAAGSISADNAAIEAAKVNLSYTRIVSPINGVVGLRQVDPGNIVHASDSTGLVVINQVHPIAVIFTLPEDQLPQVQKAMRGGSALTVEAYDRNDAHKIADGTLLTIDNQIDTTTGTAKLKAVFDNVDGSLFPNQFVNVRLVVELRQNAFVVPTAAIQSGTSGTFVFVVHPGPTPANKRPHDGPGANAAKGAKPDATAAAPPSGGAAPADDAAAGARRGPPMHVDTVPVTVDFVQGANSVLATSVLKPGDLIVIDGQEKLIDGANVQPQQTPQGAAPVTGGGANAPAGSTANPIGSTTGGTNHHGRPAASVGGTSAGSTTHP